MKYWCMPDVLVRTETSPLFPHPLFNREMTDVMTLLSMIGEVEFNSCERDVRHWSHHHTGSFSYYFPCLIHFSSMKNLCIQLFWFLVRALLFFFGFFRPLSNREMTDVMVLLSLIGEFEFDPWEKDVHNWSPHPSGSFSSSFAFIFIKSFSF